MRLALSLIMFSAGTAAVEADCDLSESTEGVCLLSLRGRRSIVTDHRGGLGSHHQALLEWKTKHQQLRQAMEETAFPTSDEPSTKFSNKQRGQMDIDMDDFIRQQSSSADACHAKMLEAKRTLDGIRKHVLALSAETEAHNNIILAQSGIIDESNTKKADAADKHATEMETCSDRYAADMEHVHGFDKELLELRQIADPSVRSAITFDTDYGKTWEERAAEETTEKNESAHWRIRDEKHADDAWAKIAEWNITKDPAAVTSLLQSMSAAQCARLATAVHGYRGINHAHIANMLQLDAEAKKAGRHALAHARHRGMTAQQLNNVSVDYVELDCNGTRTQLQLEFTSAYEEIAKLRVSTSTDATNSKKDCDDSSISKKEDHDLREDAAIREGVESIEQAQNTINSLDPLLDDAEIASTKIGAHVEDLEVNCGTATDVTEHLQKVRALITSLQTCPGRHDFQLEKPDLTNKPAALGSAGAPVLPMKA